MPFLPGPTAARNSGAQAPCGRRTRCSTPRRRQGEHPGRAALRRGAGPPRRTAARLRPRRREAVGAASAAARGIRAAAPTTTRSRARRRDRARRCSAAKNSASGSAGRGIVTDSSYSTTVLLAGRPADARTTGPWQTHARSVSARAGGSRAARRCRRPPASSTSNISLRVSRLPPRERRADGRSAAATSRRRCPRRGARAALLALPLPGHREHPARSRARDDVDGAAHRPRAHELAAVERRVDLADGSARPRVRRRAPTARPRTPGLRREHVRRGIGHRGRGRAEPVRPEPSRRSLRGAHLAIVPREADRPLRSRLACRNPRRVPACCDRRTGPGAGSERVRA